MTDKKKQKQSKKTVTTIEISFGHQVKTSNLKNAHEYYKSNVFLVEEHHDRTVRYRLVVTLDDKLVVSNVYATVKGARIGFSRMFEGFRATVKPEWTPFYKPDPDWLKQFEKCPLHRDSYYDSKKNIVLPKKKENHDRETLQA